MVEEQGPLDDRQHVSRLFAKLDVTSRVWVAIVVHDADRS